VCFIPEGQQNLEPLVNNVELKALPEPTGTVKRRSTQHYWALNITHVGCY